MATEYSKLTAKAQTTVPKTVRQTLGLTAGDRIAYTIEGGAVTVRKAAPVDAPDPAIAAFLDCLARDIATRPAHVRHLDAGLIDRARRLTDGVAVDLDADIDGDVAL